MGLEGISKLCEALDLDPLEDIRVLVLLWKLGSNEKPAQISKTEWILQNWAKINMTVWEKHKDNPRYYLVRYEDIISIS